MIAGVSPAIYLLALACPVGMGLMMFFMARGVLGGRKQQVETSDSVESLASLKAEQARLAEKIDALEKDAGELPPLGSANGNETERLERTSS